MDNELILLECEEKMEKTIEAFTRNLANIRTGRATPAMLDKVMVDIMDHQHRLTRWLVSLYRKDVSLSSRLMTRVP